jgi:hypothetical protein
MVWLGVCYKSGRDGVPKDENEALKWFKQAASHGNAKAMFQLGNYHENEALEWYERAAEQRNEDAVEALARFMPNSSSSAVRVKDSVDSAAIDRQVAGSGTAAVAAGGASNVASPAVKVEATGSAAPLTSTVDDAVADEAARVVEAKEAKEPAKKPLNKTKLKPVAEAHVRPAPAAPPGKLATLSDIEWQLPSREFVERRVACKPIGFGKYHARVQRMRVQMLVESESVGEYARKVARIECVIVPMRERLMPEWRKQSGAFRFESLRDVERFCELVNYDREKRDVLREWALLPVASDDAGNPLLQQRGKPMEPGAPLQAGVWYTLDVPYRSTSSLFVYQHSGAPLASSVDVAAPQGWFCFNGGESRTGRLLVRESERARFDAADKKKAWCFVVSRREHDAQLRKLAQYDVGERPLVIVVVSSQFDRYRALVENSAASALERAALLVLPAQLSGADVADVLPELESVGWSHRIDEQLSAGYPRLVVQLFARWRGLELIHMLDDNIDSGRLYRRRRGDVEELARLDDALTALECCIEPTDDQKREAELVKLELHPNARDKIVLVGCWRSPRNGAMMRAVNAMSTGRPYSMVLLNAKLAREKKLWYRPKPVWEDVDLIDDARAKGLAVVKMNGLAHFKTFFNNANRQPRAVRGNAEEECEDVVLDDDDDDDDDDDGDDDYDAAQPTAEDVIVTEETLLSSVSEGTYEIESESGHRAALIAHFLHGEAKRRGQQSVLVRVPKAQQRDFVAVIECVLKSEQIARTENQKVVMKIF